MEKNKNILLKIVSILLIIILNISSTNAIKITISSDISKEITWGEAFNFYSTFIDENIPESYKYINLNFKWILKDSKVYNSLQKLVYYNLINNSETYIRKGKNISWYEFYKIVEKIFELEIINSDNVEKLKNRIANKGDFTLASEIIKNKELEITNYLRDTKSIEYKKEIFSDVYSTILNSHYNKDNITEEDVITWAIEWLTKWTEDKHTVYFPPTESKNFYDVLNWEYEWIWSYVELEKPWVVKILSPIKGSPSEKAWLKWWDIILKVDWTEIEKNNSLQEVVSWIKWPSWTTVILTIKRWDNIFDLEVVRAKIIIKEVEFEKISYDTFYIEIKSFWENVSKNFTQALQALKKEKRIKKVIIDLRSNGGWYLWEVSDMLSYFVEKWESTAIVKYLKQEQKYTSKWYDLIDFNDYKIVILQNSWTASASEIMIWTIKDYYPDTTIIWEQSYWKWSVQTVKSYADWSSFKYTIAKWFTWKTHTWIDLIWITPDINLELDIEKYNKYETDNQLEKAKSIR